MNASRLPVSRSRIIGAIVVVALVAAGLAWLHSRTAAADSVLTASGTIEARVVRISPEVGGRVAQVLVDEGQKVTAGQVLVKLDDSALQAQHAQAVAALQTAQAHLDELKAGARPEEIAAAQAAVAAARAQLDKVKQGATPQDIAVAQAAVAVAQAGVRTAEGAVAAARANLARLQNGATAEDIAIAQHRLEQAKNALWGAQNQRDSICGLVGKLTLQSDCDGAKAAVQSSEEAVSIAELQLQQLQNGARKEDIAAAQAQLQQALGQLATAQAQVSQAQANLDRVKKGPTAEDIAAAQAEFDRAQAQLDLTRAGARPEEIAAAQAQVAAAQAQVQAIEVQLAKVTLAAPADGVVLSRSIEPGELASPGATLLEIGRLESLELTVYLPGEKFALVTPGQQASVHVDAYPDRTFTATVLRLADQAEFTPRNVQTVEGRKDTVFAVRLSIQNPDLALKPGMPADVTFGQK